ncbi:flagellar basal-body rod protein FlgG [Persicimonas caeni]|jgi:flagellar basal-body rod protein FlgG|uniref:Flagellar basal-body rod protein FlgG n=1 Tax=Persicimonas caeni TaxID=2292766 RepID=A0A4Y6PSZ7_PERCE|nr:flagellar basal-body rod protein FlgG [Persicimonas caeni]QDG51353.1 flagellar basal-body rod protein FlgG [Persicimonas caeni]QED32574.1 flagellar basal-body rod protein FlgG [Persicimonas caeni]
MYKALRTAASGMQAQQRKIDVTANNIANANTTGFKSSRAEFQELLYEKTRNAGDPNAGGAPTNLEVGSGVRTAATQKSFSQGNLEATDNPLDIAVEGNGFFKVVQQNGQPAYTRVGSFRVDANGQIVNADGLQLEPNINVPEEATSITIGRDGRVSVVMADDPAEVEIGQLELANFANPAGLDSLGRGLFAETVASGPERMGLPGEGSTGALSQGYLETSNVEVTEEMISMIVSQRSYELNSKVIRTADEMLQSTTNIR